MIQRKHVSLFLVAGLAVSAGSLWADNAAPASTVQTTPSAVATVVHKAKAAKQDSPTVTAMKAAIALADAGKTAEAVAAYEKMGVLKSKTMEAWRLNNEALAYLQAATPVPEKAVPLLEKSVATDENNYIAWNNLGSAYEQTDQLEKAKDAYQKSIDAAQTANASSAKAEGNLQNLQPKLDKLAAKNGEDQPATTPVGTPAAEEDQSK
jgi:tetratricopeptide (TPR) repeat protein